MEDKDVDNLIAAMKSNSCKMVSATLMAALVGAGLAQNEANKKMEAILPELGKYSTSLSGLPATVFSVNFLVWSLPDTIRSGFFRSEDLTWPGLVGAIQSGAEEWQEICKNQNVPLSEIAPLFTAMKVLLNKLFESQGQQPEVVGKLIAIQDHFLKTFK